MKKSLFLCIAAILLASFVQAQSGPKVGFVNLKKIFKDYQKIKDMEQRINRETEKEMAKIKGLEEEVKVLRDEIPLYRPGSKIRERKEKELTDKLFEIKYRKDKASYFFAEKMKSGIEEIYREVVKEIEKYAERRSFFMILRVSDADFFGAKSADALKMEIKTRDVLYWGKKYDITDTIIEVMNKKYAEEKK
jgi:Skp family chaperone for outer membrane proteins